MKYFLGFSLVLLSLVFFSGFENVEAIISGHPLKFWDISDVILDGTVIERFNETNGLVQHDIRVEKYFKNPKPQQMITVYGPSIHSEDWFYPKVFEKGERVLLYLKKVDDKHIILEQSRAATEQCDPRSMIGLSTLPGEGFARGGPTLYFDPYQTCNGYLTPPGFLRGYSPLKQIQAGIKFGDFGCNKDLQPMFKHDSQPACVKQSSVSRLLDYGWTLIDRKAELELRIPLPTIQIVELPKKIEAENPVDFSIEVLDIKENHERPTITITDENGKTVWSGQHQVPDASSGMTHDIQYRVLYHMKYYPEEINLESGTYMLNVSLPSQTITKKIKVEMSENSNQIIVPSNNTKQPEPTDEYYPVDPVDIVNANNQFALDFYSKISQNNENIFFSPTSISTAFAILYEGARENTADEIQSVFGFPENDLERKHGYLSLYNTINEKNDENVLLHIANALWLAESFEPLPEYLNTATKYYDSTVTSVDFVSDDGVNKINDWVKSKTEEKIEKLLEPGSTGSTTRMAITNAIYFKGLWEHPFDPEDTYEADFVVSPEKTVKVQMMTFPHKMQMNVAFTEQMKMLELPYKNNTASMLIILPNEIDGLKSIEDSLTLENLASWKSMLDKKGSGTVIHLPKFSLETDYNLQKTLPDMGMPSAFNAVHADFGGIAGYKGLYISQAIHKAFVDVNEEGTEAAGATAIVLDESGGQLFKADHPFIFLIQDKDTNSILFIGKIVEPVLKEK